MLSRPRIPSLRISCICISIRARRCPDSPLILAFDKRRLFLSQTRNYLHTALPTGSSAWRQTIVCFSRRRFSENGPKCSIQTTTKVRNSTDLPRVLHRASTVSNKAISLGLSNPFPKRLKIDQPTTPATSICLWPATARIPAARLSAARLSSATTASVIYSFRRHLKSVIEYAYPQQPMPQQQQYQHQPAQKSSGGQPLLFRAESLSLTICFSFQRLHGLSDWNLRLLCYRRMRQSFACCWSSKMLKMEQSARYAFSGTFYLFVSLTNFGLRELLCLSFAFPSNRSLQNESKFHTRCLLFALSCISLIMTSSLSSLIAVAGASQLLT